MQIWQNLREVDGNSQIFLYRPPIVGIVSVRRAIPSPVSGPSTPPDGQIPCRNKGPRGFPGKSPEIGGGNDKFQRDFKWGDKWHRTEANEGICGEEAQSRE